MATSADKPDATEANLKAALAEEMLRQQTGKSDLNMTKEESDKFTTAFGDPEFRKLMADYGKTESRQSA